MRLTLGQAPYAYIRKRTVLERSSVEQNKIYIMHMYNNKKKRGKSWATVAYTIHTTTLSIETRSRITQSRCSHIETMRLLWTKREEEEEKWNLGVLDEGPNRRTSGGVAYTEG